MTATLTAVSRASALTARLDEVRVERDRALAELTPSGSGDAADRATNVDVQARLEMLEQRIMNIEADLTALPTAQAADGVLSEGDVVTLDLGEGPEDFLLGSINQSSDGLAVITPGSPLGQALLGATVGSSVRYTTSARHVLDATVIAIS